MPRRLLSLIAFVVGVAGAAACTEQLEGGAACPTLCPQTDVVLRDTIIEAVTVDSTFTGYPPIGFEEALLLAKHGDTLDTRVIVRFDSLPMTFTKPDGGVDSIRRVDSATIVVKLRFASIDTTTRFEVDAYDVDTTVAGDQVGDTVVATLRALFRPGRFLGTLAVNPSGMTDSTSTIRVPVSDSAILHKIRNQERLRVGFAIRPEQGKSASVLIEGQGLPTDLSLRFRASTDSTFPAIQVTPVSRTPNSAFLRAPLTDYQVDFASFRPPTNGVIVVGGIPGRRSYLRFDLPRGIVDSSRVVRATLLLTQIANPLSAERGDSVWMAPEVLTASQEITSLERAVLFTSPTFTFGGGTGGLAQVKLVPNSSGVRNIEIAPLVLAWSVAARDSVPRAIVLRLDDEGMVGGTLLFHSREATIPSLRPRVRLTYAPTLEFGLP